MTELRNLHSEYIALKEELFGSSMFVIVDVSTPEMKKKWNRYQTLLEVFHPTFRRRMN